MGPPGAGRARKEPPPRPPTSWRDSDLLRGLLPPGGRDIRKPAPGGPSRHLPHRGCGFGDAVGSSLGGGQARQGRRLPGSHSPAPAGCPSEDEDADPGRWQARAGTGDRQREREGWGRAEVWLRGKRRGDLGREWAQRPLRRLTGAGWTFAGQTWKPLRVPVASVCIRQRLRPVFPAGGRLFKC